MARTAAAPPVASGRARRAARRVDSASLFVYTGLAVVYLLLPVFVIVLFSFNDPAGKSNFVWQGFTLEYWADPLGVPGLPPRSSR